MFMVSEADAAAIRSVYEAEGELSAAIELRRRFPGIIDNARAQECARSIAGSIAGWTPLAIPPRLARRRARKDARAGFAYHDANVQTGPSPTL
jgi:hypothetical protein